MSKPTVATVWLDGCSGCHMSLLDCDERMLAVFSGADLVYSPLVDTLDFPDRVDITLVEGAVSNQDDLSKVRMVRAHSRVLVALGDCAVTSNVPSMRNAIPVATLLHSIYVEGADAQRSVPSSTVPTLLPQARPLHDYVTVDVHIPGCPPKPELILTALLDLVEGRKPSISATKFG